MWQIQVAMITGQYLRIGLVAGGDIEKRSFCEVSVL